MNEEQTKTAQDIFDAIEAKDSTKLKELFGSAVNARVVDIIKNEVRPEVVDEINGVFAPVPPAVPEPVAAPVAPVTSVPEPAK